MSLPLSIAIFLVSCVFLAAAGNWLIGALTRIAHFLKFREFIASFFLMSFATSIPELLVGITAALQGIPELSFGNIVGQNIIHFTLAVALCTLILKEIEVESKTVQISTLYTIFIAIFPLLLIADGTLSRGDGAILIASFILYSAWLFAKKKHFTKTYEAEGTIHPSPFVQFKAFAKDVGIFLVGAAVLLVSAQGVVVSAVVFAEELAVPLVLIGVLIVGAGTALPETYFAVAAARRGNAWMLVGNLMGATAVSSSLVLGTVALLNPIVVTNFSPYLVSRVFLVASAVFFLVFLRTGRVITRREGIALLALYAAFVALEIWRGNV